MIDINKSEQLANKIRKHSLEMTSIGKSSHIASVLSMADILAVLYGTILKYKSDAHLILRYTNHPEDSDLVALRENQVISISR